MHLFYTDQVDECTTPEHKSALSILVVPHPASCWPNTKCWMSSHSITKHWKVQYLTCLTRVPHPVCEQAVVMSALVLGFYWLSAQEVLATYGRWLMVVCPRLTCSSSTRQVSQFRNRWSAEQNTSSSGNIECIRHHILNPTFLDVKWYHCCSSVWPCVLFLCPDCTVEYVFPQPLPILMICSAWWVINEGFIAVIQLFEPGPASSRQAEVSWVPLVLDDVCQ